MHICFFMGHRDAPPDIYPRIRNAAKDCIESHGETDFIIGCHGTFDAMAARAIIELKHIYPGIRLTMLVHSLPPKPLPPGFDSSYYPPGMEAVPKKFSIVRANQYMALHCDTIILYAVYPGSNTWKMASRLQSRVRRKNLQVIRL